MRKVSADMGASRPDRDRGGRRAEAYFRRKEPSLNTGKRNARRGQLCLRPERRWRAGIHKRAWNNREHWEMKRGERPTKDKCGSSNMSRTATPRPSSTTKQGGKIPREQFSKALCDRVRKGKVRKSHP